MAVTLELVELAADAVADIEIIVSTETVLEVETAGPQGPPGPAPVPEGPWSAAGVYQTGDLVAYGGSTYIARNPVGPTASTPTADPVNWQLFAAQGPVGDPGPAGAAGAPMDLETFQDWVGDMFTGNVETGGTLVYVDGTGKISFSAEVTTAIMNAAITAAVNALIDGAPGALDTLNELAAAMADDAAFSATVTNALAGKVDKSTLLANSILKADVNGTPANLALGASTVPARLATGGVVAATPAQIRALLVLAKNTQAVAAYTLVLTDAWKMVEMNFATANDWRIPTNATAAFPTDTEIEGGQVAAGQTSIIAVTPGTTTIRCRGMTVGTGTVKSAGQWAEWRARKRAADEWVITGDVVVT